MDERVWKGSGKGLEFFWEDALGTLEYDQGENLRANHKRQVVLLSNKLFLHYCI